MLHSRGVERKGLRDVCEYRHFALFRSFTGSSRYHHCQVRFRPEVEGWGDRATFYCANIIDLIPPEDEVDLAVHGTLPAERAEQDKSSMIRPKEEQLDADAEEVVKQENEDDVREMKAEEGGFEVKREDVFEGFWEAEYDDDV